MEQPIVQTRIGSFRDRALTSLGKILDLSASKASGSRKKRVTLIRMSWYNASTSAGVSRSTFRYCVSPSTFWRTMRRVMRR